MTTVAPADALVATAKITGAVTIEGAAAAGVTAMLSTGTAVTTDAAGAYAFQNLKVGSYSVTISGFPTDATFATTTKSTTIPARGQVVTVNFDGAYLRTAAILGSVSAGGRGLSGVRVALTGANTWGVNVNTDSNGQYGFSGLRAGSYTLTISGFDATQYAFASTTATVTVAVGESKSASFSGTRYTIGEGLDAEQFALIQPGTFQMGSTTAYSDQLPVHTVNITKAFYLQKTEVTQGQWKAVMGTNPSYFPSCGDTCPVEQVSWNDIQDFLTKLNQANPGANYRLPTEAEWEYAARAGTTGDYGGNGVLDDMGWYATNSGSVTHAVAQKRANAWGLYDMHGNVWEWVQDWYSSSYYSVSPTNDPTGPTTGSLRVLRGGSWAYDADGARSAYRVSNYPSGRYSSNGFRLARTP